MLTIGSPYEVLAVGLASYLDGFLQFAIYVPLVFNQVTLFKYCNYIYIVHNVEQVSGFSWLHKMAYNRITISCVYFTCDKN